jgi:hypothetical protein
LQDALGARWTRQKWRGAGIYYYHSEVMPLYLLAMFAKNEQANLSKADRNSMAKLVDILVATWIER